MISTRLLPAVLVAVLFLAGATAALAGSSATVLLYHRFGEDSLPSTSVTVDQLEAHIAELTSGGYRVLPLPEVVRAINEDVDLPDRAVAITVDDAFRSFWEVGWPRFKAAGLPVTLFVSTDAIDQGRADYMTWDELRIARDQGVTIGNQTAAHPHLPRVSDDAAARQIGAAAARLRAELGLRPHLIAYPYGEAGLREMALARSFGFRAGFGQHSGVVSPAEPRYFLPRFSMNGRYGDLERLRLAASALPLATADWSPEDPVLRDGNPPAIGFTLLDAPDNVDRLTCYASDAKDVDTSVLGYVRVEVRIGAPLPRGRSRLNCTLPGPDGRWHWVGRQFYVP